MIILALLVATVTPAKIDHVVASGDTRRVVRSGITVKRPVLDHTGKVIPNEPRIISVEQILEGK